MNEEKEHWTKKVDDIVEQYISLLSVAYIALCLWLSYNILREVGILGNMKLLFASGVIFCLGIGTGIFTIVIVNDIGRRLNNYGAEKLVK